MRLEKMAYPFAIDSHFSFRIDTEIFYFIDILDTLHIRGIASRTENDCNLRTRINVV